MLVYNKPLPVHLKGSVIDLETNNNNEITTFGIISGGTILSLTREYRDIEDVLLKQMDGILAKAQRPYYAYVKSFESRYLNIPEKEFIELQVVRFEAKREAIHYKHILDPLFGDGKKCLSNWDRYVKSRGVSKYLAIAIQNHNIACLLQELSLVILNTHLYRDRRYPPKRYS